MLAGQLRNSACPAEPSSLVVQFAVGECGLDYDRLSHCSKETQLAHFEPQLSLARRYNLPLFLHSRAAHTDVLEVLRRVGKGELRGVVHSHSESLEQAQDYINEGFYIGIK